MLSGYLGGLPVTQVIVRSSANIQSGAESKASTVMHGVLLAVSVIWLPVIMNLIPLASLAAILFVVGYKLAKPAIFKKMFGQGLGQFIPFVATVLGIVFTDLLIGIGIGIHVAVIVILLESYRLPFRISNLPQERGERVRIALAEHVTFLNKASVLKTLDGIPEDSHVEIDTLKSAFIHPDVVEIIDNYVIAAKAKNIHVEVSGLESHRRDREPTGMKIAVEYPSTHLEMGDAMPELKNGDRVKQLSPQSALELLKEGNARFMSGLRIERNLLEQVHRTAEGQNPYAVILSCIDSRTSAELIFDQGLGDVFSIRVAGNVLSEDIIGSMEFACKVAGSKLIVVMGHSACGAMKGACEGATLGSLSGLLRKIQPSIQLAGEERKPESDGFCDRVAEKNVELVVREIRERSPVLDEMIDSGEIGLVGAFYSVSSAEVQFHELHCGTPARQEVAS